MSPSQNSSGSKNGIADLRQEVAHLQGSIEKLTSELTNEATAAAVVPPLPPSLTESKPNQQQQPVASNSSTKLFHGGKHNKSSESSE